MRVSRLQLRLEQWPQEDQRRWQNAFREGDIFDDDCRGAHLSEATRRALRVSYAQYLRFRRPRLLRKTPAARIDRKLIEEYVGLLKRTHQDISVATTLHHLRLALKLICPKEDWSWLLTITKRIAASAPRKPRRYGLVSIEQLYLLGIALMDQAASEAANRNEISKDTAMNYRDGLLITLLSLLVPRRRTVTALRVGKQLVKTGDLWALDIPPEDVKGKRPLDFALSRDFCNRIDLYLQKYRPRIPGAMNHTALWPSNKGGAMSAGAIYDTVCKRTKKKFGLPVNPHRFRHAAGTLWSITDPKNVRGVKDLLGHASFKPTEAHYLLGQSRHAGRTLANAIDSATS
jgi:integrase/recombinase XerD